MSPRTCNRKRRGIDIRARHAPQLAKPSCTRASVATELRVVDDRDTEVPRGTVGEAVVRRGTVMLGYWNKPEETATALRGGWMHAGDGGYMGEGGYLYRRSDERCDHQRGRKRLLSRETQIASYKCPRSIEFRDALPMTGAGKVLKADLRKQFWTGRARAGN